VKGTASAAVLAAALALGCRRELPPLGEALVVVDTDVPVPGFANRLRVDLYTVDRSTWYVSREIAAPDPSVWPLSFGVYDPDGAPPRQVVVRLRAFQGGVVRDYRGERYTPRATSGGAGDPAPIAPIPDGEAPRLYDEGGHDVTPGSEPLPYVTIDRLVQIDLQPGVRGSVRIVLHGVCAGTMADLVGGSTCVDQENVTVSISDAALDADLSLPTATLEGTFGAETPCTATPRAGTTLPDGTRLFDEEACVPGRMFVFGSALAYGRGVRSDVPQRPAVLPPFLMDRFEVTVGRWRDALGRGFSPTGGPVANPGPLDFGNAAGMAACTWSDAPMGRETLPLNCVDTTAARAFCRFQGGDLPTEAQREYVAMDAGRPAKTPYPWGDEAPTCQRAVYARQAMGAFDGHTTDCNKLGVGLPAADAVAGDPGDVATGTRVVDLSGSLSEIVGDTFASLGSACWASQGLTSPSCVDPSSPDLTLRGGSWADNAATLTGDIRDALVPGAPAPVVGFRCVRPVP
jgi:formylglycine-generating enzyme required for sulfatase activity